MESKADEAVPLTPIIHEGSSSPRIMDHRTLSFSGRTTFVPRFDPIPGPDDTNRSNHSVIFDQVIIDDESISKEFLKPDEYHLLEADMDVRQRAFTFSPKAPSNAPTILTWKDLSVTTKSNPPKVLLKNISGSITGGFWAIMGASGGGKTTLLSTLSLRLDPNRMAITGDMRLNGRDYKKENLKAMSAYVMQDDLLHPELTVAETLSYAAQLRFGAKVTAAWRKEREIDVLELMGINHVRDVVIGDARVKGISGGERKRVSIAIELLTSPKLIFLDEPTSGLDSSTALSVCSSLKQLCDDGVCTVVCTIHQPQVRIFELFDNLILMKKGQIVYQGGSKKSLLFLENAGLPCPPGVNPADHLLESITPKEVDNAFDHNAKLTVPVNLSLGHDKEFSSYSKVAFQAWFSQFLILFRRSSQQYLRRWDIILMNFVITVILAIFVSCGLWQDIGTTQRSIALRAPSLFFASVTQGIVAALQCISSFPKERAVILRERAAGSYFVSSYFVAKTCVDTLSCSWGPFIFSVIAYPIIGYQNDARKFFIYAAFMILDALAALSLATMCSCLCVSIEMSTVVLSLVLEISRLFGGFFTSPKQLDDFQNWKFADALSYLKYTFVGVALNELNGLKLSCTDAQRLAGGTNCIETGEVINAQRGYDEYTVDLCAGALIAYIAGARLVAYLALRFIKT